MRLNSFYFFDSYVKLEYFGLIIFLLIAIVITIIILGASYFLSEQNPDAEKLSAYECGFEPYEDARYTFDIKFCVIAILFIVFDIEIMFLTPWCVSLAKLDICSFWAVFDFIFDLGIGFFYVWYVKALDW